MYRIVAFDLDGTLLSPDHTLSLYAKKTLKLLINQGMKLVFATGRHHVDVKQILNNLKIKTYMITSNGARVHDIVGNLIYAQNLDLDISTNLFKIVYNHPYIITNIYKDKEWFINRSFLDKKNFFRESIFNYSLYNPESLDSRGVSKIFFTCDKHKELLLLEKLINSNWGNRVNVSFSTLTCLEVMAGNVSKGKALEILVKNLGCTLKECIAFGDGMNDAEMLSMVGKGCIMANAHQRLKDLYPNLEVIGTNADNAVPIYLHKLFLK